MKSVQVSSKSSENHFRTIFRRAPDGMSISRLKDGLFVDVNDSFSEMFGYRRDEIVGKTSYELKFWRNFLDRDALVESLANAESIDNFEAAIV